MPYSFEDQKSVKELLAFYKTAEERLKNSPWVSPHQKKFIKEGDPLRPKREKQGLAWLRRHFNKGRNMPSVEQIKEHLFEGRGMDGMDIHEMLAEVSKSKPTKNYFKDTLYLHIYDLLGGNWCAWEPSKEGPLPATYHLPTVHCDKTCEMGLRYYYPTSRDGKPMPFDEDNLSQELSAIVARTNHGNYGLTKNIDGEPFRRYDVPEPDKLTKAIRDKKRDKARALLEIAEKQEQESPYISMARRRKYAEDVYIPQEKKAQEVIFKRQKAELKQLAKDGHVSQADYKAFDVEARLKEFEDGMKKKFLDTQFTNELKGLEDHYLRYRDDQKK